MVEIVKVKGKSKGSNFEREKAKELSIWMFDNPNVLYRHGSSGARKNVYSGDIVPEAELIEHGWKTWPFVIELKTGYKQHIPTLGNQTHLKKWLSKLLNECNAKQACPIFMWQLYKASCIFLTTEKLKIHWELVLNLERNGQNIYFFVYDYKTLLKYKFMSIIPDNIRESIG
jgi:hypothetical protein